MVKKAGRRNRVRNRVRNNTALVRQVTVRPVRVRRARRKRANNKRRAMMPQMSPAGLAFLKCAFAPPDFNNDPGKGIPDSYEGPTLSRKDNLTASIAFTAGKDTFLLFTPTPGIAYWKAEVNVGFFPTTSTNFTPVSYPGTVNIFGPPGATAKGVDDVVNAFRYASLAAGIYPTVNEQQWSGSITLWKIGATPTHTKLVQVVGVIPPVNITTEMIEVAGLDGVLQVPNQNYATGFVDGVFASSTNADADFDFDPVWRGIARLPATGAGSDDTIMPFNLDATGSNVPDIYGWGKMDTIVMRVSTPAAAVNSAIVKVWSCIEYKPTAGSAFSTFATMSPPLDVIALSEYRRVAREMPLAVKAADNARMWETIKSILGFGIGMATALPGPVGMAAGGVMSIATALKAMGLGF